MALKDNKLIRSFEGHTASVLSVGFVRHGQQLMSTSADGLVKLWTIRTGECENTMDKHEDKIWAIATGKGQGKTFFSAGSDSKLHMWTDATESLEEERLKKQESTLLIEQQMQNDIRGKNYGKALHAALELGQERRTVG